MILCRMPLLLLLVLFVLSFLGKQEPFVRNSTFNDGQGSRVRNEVLGANALRAQGKKFAVGKKHQELSFFPNLILKTNFVSQRGT